MDLVHDLPEVVNVTKTHVQLRNPPVNDSGTLINIIHG
jgi:hypothetical protein